ncbi:MAG TPA: hypothetical protein VMW94_01645 [Actinomycetes bacterium]|nr:hypothetical protein [Actinomycetes bacterium]
MALPSETQIRDLILKACTTLDDARSDAATNFVTNHETFLAAAGAYSTGSLISAFAAAEENRSRQAAVVSTTAAAAVLTPLWETYFEVKGFQQGAFSRSMELLREAFNTASDSVNSRGITYGSASAGGSNVGNGAIYRCTVDKYGEPYEACFLETKTFRCISDQQGVGGGTRHQERFLVTGAPVSQDQIVRAGSGGNTTIECASARNSLLGNSSFDSFQGTAAIPTSFSSWTINTIGNTAADGTNYYRTAGGNTAPTPYALKMTGAVTVTQKLSVRNIQINPHRPTFCALRYNRSVGTGTGILTLRMGSQNVAVADLSAAGAGWNLLQIPPDANAYLTNFDEDQIDIQIELSGSPSGYMLVDDLIFQQLQPIDGTYWIIVGGATPFQLDDSFTVADSATDASIVQKWLWRTYGEYLPSDNAGSETWSGS